jgi:hypothetical protein
LKFVFISSGWVGMSVSSGAGASVIGVSIYRHLGWLSLSRQATKEARCPSSAPQLPGRVPARPASLKDIANMGFGLIGGEERPAVEPSPV